MLVIIYKWITLSGLKIVMQNRILDESRDTELSIALNLSCKEWLSTKIYAFEDRHLRAWLVSEPLILVYIRVYFFDETLRAISWETNIYFISTTSKFEWRFLEQETKLSKILHRKTQNSAETPKSARIIANSSWRKSYVHLNQGSYSLQNIFVSHEVVS